MGHICSLTFLVCILFWGNPIHQPVSFVLFFHNASPFNHTHFLLHLSSPTLHNLGGVKCQPFLKRSNRYVTDFIPLNHCLIGFSDQSLMLVPYARDSLSYMFPHFLISVQ